MDCIKFEYLVEQTSKIPAFKIAKLFIQKKDGLHNFNGSVAVEDIPFDMLRRLDGKMRYVALEKPSRIMFHIKFHEHDVILIIKSSGKANIQKMNEQASRLQECAKSAMMTYQANHDELTGVLNRHGIKRGLQLVGDAFDCEPLNQEDSNQEFLSNQDVTLFSFDIDKFKSVNDVYGHQVGDGILAIFANRLSAVAAEISEEYSAKFIVGRPGGEEFDIIAIGSLSKNEISEISKRILDRIRNPSLPSVGDVEYIQKVILKTIKKYEYPERITASVGVSSRGVGKSGIINSYYDLKVQADKALYRAKADGRNCLRLYDEIIIKHGRVLESFADSNLIKIDIGAGVGVKLGDVFSVRFPPFSGNENILESERSEKIIGLYPEIVSAIVVVINVQKEVAICTIVEKVNSSPIAKGSSLKYIFKGSIVPNYNRLSNPDLGLSKNYSSFIDAVGEHISDGKLSAVCKINGKYRDGDAREMAVKYDEFISILRGVLPPGTQFFSRTGIGIFCLIKKFRDVDLIQQKRNIEKSANLLKEIKYECYINACFLEDLPEDLEKSPQSMIFYANTIPNTFGDEKKVVEFFSIITPAKTLAKWRKSRSYNDSISDYHQYVAFGHESAESSNQLGLIIIENHVSDYHSIAEIAFRKAIELGPVEPAYRANLGSLLTQQGRFSEAYAEFSGIDAYLKEKKNETYTLYYAKSALENSEVVDKEVMAQILLNAVESMGSVSKNSQNRKWQREVSKAIKSKEFD